MRLQPVVEGLELIFEDSPVSSGNIVPADFFIHLAQLTVNQVENDAFEVNIIPHTAHSVTLTLKGPGDRVNLEFDIIGKYVERLLKKDDNTNLESLLKKHGFM